MANEPGPNKSEVSLEDIVRDGSSGAIAPGTGPAGGMPPVIDVSAVDQLLAVEDPQFAASMKELRAQVAEDAGNVVIDSLDLEEKPLSKFGLLKVRLKTKFETIRHLLHTSKARFSHFRTSAGSITKDFAVRSAKTAGEGAKASGAKLKELLGAFKHLPLKSKLLVFSTLVLGVLSLTILKMVMKGKYLPTLETRYLRSFADVASGSFKYDADEPMEDFTDPFFHPEHVMLIDKIVVNLRRPEDGSNPMGLFEFYLEASSDEGAIEIKDREIEVRDLMSRTLERMSYEELVTVAGKNKAKLVLRKAMNQFMTKGRVRRVYFRNVVLKV